MKSKKSRKSITLCSSAAFFKDMVPIEKQLKRMGFNVKLPYTFMVMKRTGDYRPETYKTWFKDASTYKKKAWLIKNHLKKVTSGDAVLVVNNEKKGMKGYIGGNTLIEMAFAFHQKKPIYILNAIPDSMALKEEVLGMQPIFLDGDVSKIRATH